MKIKTFPLQFVEPSLEAIATMAKAKGMSIKDFIHEAIAEKMEKEKVK